jgi:hypothetical protein
LKGKKMTMNAHTPGPWRIHKGAYSGQTFVVSGPESEPFMGQVIAEKTTCPDWPANARLIASAPELVAALESVIRICEYNCPGEASPAIALARAALAKVDVN